MGILGGSLGYGMLKRIARGGGTDKLDGSAYATRSKLEVLLGSAFLDYIRGRNVIDFGCGVGADSVEMAKRGAARVMGVDIQEHLLDRARGVRGLQAWNRSALSASLHRARATS